MIVQRPTVFGRARIASFLSGRVLRQSAEFSVEIKYKSESLLCK